MVPVSSGATEDFVSMEYVVETEENVDSEEGETSDLMVNLVSPFLGKAGLFFIERVASF